MSSFESFMVNRLDNFAENQRNLHDLCVTNFQNFDNRFQSMDTCFQTLMGEKIEDKFCYSFYAWIALFWTIMFSSLPKVYL